MSAIHLLSARAVQASKARLRKNPAHDRDFAEYSLSDGGGLYLCVTVLLSSEILGLAASIRATMLKALSAMAWQLFIVLESSER